MEWGRVWGMRGEEEGESFPEPNRRWPRMGMGEWVGEEALLIGSDKWVWRLPDSNKSRGKQQHTWVTWCAMYCVCSAIGYKFVHCMRVTCTWHFSGSWQDSITMFGLIVYSCTHMVGNCRRGGKEKYFNPLCYFRAAPKWISIKLAFSWVANVTGMSCGAITGMYKGEVNNIH